jgi:2-aminoadipate transaminase
MSTFSKTLAPGLRVAWVVAPAAVIRLLTQAKQGTDLHTATFTQMVTYETARAGFLDRHVRHLRDVYRARRDAMLAALAEHFPAGARWSHPEGGLFVWCTLPAGADTSVMLRAALEQHVAYIPGAAFHAKGGGENTLRLNFSAMPPERIAEGIARLGRVFRAAPGAKQPPALVTIPPREDRALLAEIPVI